MWGCPGLVEKLPDIEWEGEIPYGLMRPSESKKLKNCWDFDIIVPLHLNMEVNPTVSLTLTWRAGMTTKDRRLPCNPFPLERVYGSLVWIKYTFHSTRT
ncbi:unnamed protein product [Pseudo-nitzschia multistriata]|uniref:Uncharacterized protein n=1 Tax=Pseudo-nitzschia multistriata TaxID=183589 RepID=A0A448ZLB6_9STRA|nr:unnamed protein product [Pseudo-nitzschia multistriata]